MQKRQIGRSSLQVAPLAFGGNVFGWTIDEKESFRILDAFIEAGFNFIDTADVYSRWNSGVGGESETIIGKWMKARNNRGRIVLATKVGMDMGDGKSGLSKKYIVKAVEDSLRRLQTDHIDLYQSHKDDEATPVEETLEAYARLIEQGKVRYIGASNFSAARLQAALDAASRDGLPRYECLQPHYNLCVRKVYETELMPVCEKNQLSVISYYSLASGFLTGKYKKTSDLDQSVRGRGASKYMNERGFRILNAVEEVARIHNSAAATTALAWLLAKPCIAAPIASATNLKQLNELMAAPLLNLSKDDIRTLDQASEGE